MCGISCLVPAVSANGVTTLVQAMNDRIRHRGPDDEGFVCFDDSGAPTAFWGQDTPREILSSSVEYAPRSRVHEAVNVVGRVVFGHRRLSIVDLSPHGHQPMCTPGGRYWIVYNGEVYNYPELRAELSAGGRNFTSNSDTEVILAAYMAWGKDCVNRFNGMFAFIVYDTDADVLFAARDRFGVKPFYYMVSEGGVAFASEIKQFLGLPGWKGRLNHDRAFDFLNWGRTDHTDETLFKGVFQLRGGEALEMPVVSLRTAGSGCRLPVYRWYRGIDGSNDIASAPEYRSAVGQFRQLIADAVRLRLRSDVPVGSCLSGGLDSSSIVCLANALLRQNDAHFQQKTFSSCSRFERFDERRFVDIVAAHAGVDSHCVYPELGHLFEQNSRLTWFQDEPFGTTSVFAQWKVFELAAAAGVKVMLDGQGADEQLAGYDSFVQARLRGLVSRRAWAELARELRALRRAGKYPPSALMKLTVLAALPLRVKRWLWRLVRGKKDAALSWIDLDVLRISAGLADFRDQDDRTVRSLSVDQLLRTNLPKLLHWEDRDSMAHSLESRVPFLDYRLVEFSLRVPDGFKFSEGVTKRILRDAMESVLPEPIKNRTDKMGFVTPEEAWLREDGADQFRSALSRSIVAAGGVIRDDARQLLEEMIAGKKPYNSEIWRMISFGCWMEVFDVAL